MADTHIPAEYQCEINEWLCLKQECEEVLSSVASNSAEEDDENIDDSDASSSVKSEKGKRGLGPIREYLFFLIFLCIKLSHLHTCPNTILIHESK